MPVCENKNTIVLRNQEVHINREVLSIGQIKLETKNEKSCILIYVAIPEDRIVTQKEAEKKINTRVYC
jgi:hypothetical protein